MKSPFKFLDAYTSADKEIFFGREEEIETLYNMVFKTPLVLVYGMSGTGKTSLIQCGLSTRFDGPDWLPFYIRRDHDINESLKKALSADLENKEYTTLPTAVEDLFYSYFRPVYLIFDQFEELFILGSHEEQQQFLQDIQILIEQELPCKIILVMREEYLGQLYDFEKVVPGIFDFKLRVEPMSNKRVKSVMMQSFEYFNIQLEDPQEELCQQMIDNISAGKSGIALTYLQVYLDMLYREDFARTYPDTIPDERYPSLEFTKSEVEHFGKIDDVLDRYLKEKVIDIQEDLKIKFPNGDTEDGVQTLLDIFVTEEGTKRPLGYAREDDLIVLEGNITERLHTSKEITSYCVLQLEEARLIRFDEDSIELGHDTLADLIDQQRTDAQRQLNDIKKRLLSDYKHYKQTEEFLSERRLNLYEEYLPNLLLNDLQSKFIEDSKIYNEQKIAQEKERDKREQEQQQRELQLTKEKLLTEKKARRRQYFFMGILTLALIASMVLASWAFREQQRAKIKTEEADEATQKAELLNQKLLSSSKDRTLSEYEKYLERAKRAHKNTDLIQAQNNALKAQNLLTIYIRDLSTKKLGDTIIEKYDLWIDTSKTKAVQLLNQLDIALPKLPKYRKLLKAGQRKEADTYYVQAYYLYLKAREALFTPEIDILIKQVRSDGFQYYLDKGKAHMESVDSPADNEQAIIAFKNALKLNEQSSLVKKLIREVQQR